MYLGLKTKINTGAKSEVLPPFQSTPQRANTTLMLLHKGEIAEPKLVYDIVTPGHGHCKKI